MWEHRADRARREIASLATTGIGAGELHAAALATVEAQVPTELTCWATLDPTTLTITGMVSGSARLPGGYEPALATAEYDPGEPNRFADLARRGQVVARSSELPARERRRSGRLRNVWRPLGLDREVRTTFLADGSCWGAAGLVRRGSDFTDREVEFLAAVAPAVASATRVTARTGVRGSSDDTPPAVVVVDTHGRTRSSTASTATWAARIDAHDPGRFALLAKVLALEARTSGRTARAHVRDGHGWAVLASSALVGDEPGLVAVTVSRAAGEELTDVIAAAYGLTPRERQVCEAVVAGHPTTRIARLLGISSYTVQDHLKSVYAKVGVRSRGELVARLRP
ncbi:helix-turn-helix transcriptional regulator [Mumia sp. DW29H23]|uniref:helix-turn-helix transcriptional regulator n=1 Tax=Mumia sp. DW29H23 TaxID=3421241 RepID=UPI003D6994F7